MGGSQYGPREGGSGGSKEPASTPVPSLHSRGLLLGGHRLQREWRPLCGWKRLQQWPLLQRQRLQFHQWPRREWQQLQHAHHLQDIFHQEELQELKALPASAASSLFLIPT